MRKRILLLVYVLLLFIKLFTCLIDFRMEEAPLLVLKSPFETENFVRSGEDKYIIEHWTSDKWYVQGNFIVLMKTNGNDIFRLIYKIIICCWWLGTILIGGAVIYKLFSYKK